MLMRENHRLEEALKAGVDIPDDGYWGDIPSKICGAYGGKFDESMVKETAEGFKNKIVRSDKNSK